MRKGQLFNAEICYTLAKLGHTDSIAIADAGLPIPEGIQRIDLALTHGIPSFLQVFDSVSQDMQIEQVILAEEIRIKNSEIHNAILKRIQRIQNTQHTRIITEYVSHELFKTQTGSCKAILRTGECTPYANIILRSGVIF